MRRCLIALVLPLVSIAVLAGCGGGGGTEAKGVSVKTVQLAAENTQAAQSTQFTMTIAVAVGDRNETVTASGVGSGDGKLGRVVLEAPGGGHIEELIVEDAIYMNLDGLRNGSQELPDGKHWLRIGFDDLAGKLGLDLGELRDQAQSSTPASGLQYLQGLSGDVTRVADDTINGEHATRYRASLDYSLVADKLGSLSATAKNQLRKLGIVPADVWIDDHDRVVKMHYTISGSAFGADSASGTAEVTMEITAFDVPVDVQAPPADEVIDITDLPGAVGAPSGTIPA
jgi:hypothetical protein